MSWTDSYELPYATVIGRFGSIVSDSLDPDLRPDIIPLAGTVTLAPTVPYIKINGTVLQIATITAQVVNGVIVNPDGSEGIRILSTDVENDTITNWGWRATFKIPDVRITPVSFYAVKDEVIDLVNLTSGITGLPVEIAPGPKGDKGDPGEDGHTPEITFDGTTIVVDGTPGPDLKGDPGEGGGGAGGFYINEDGEQVPYVMVASEQEPEPTIVIDGRTYEVWWIQTSPPDPNAWVPKLVTQAEGSRAFVVPDDAGAVYTVDGLIRVAGTYAVPGVDAASVSWSAAPRSGYAFAPGAVMSGTFEFPARTYQPGDVVFSDSFAREGALAGSATDSFEGGDPLTWVNAMTAGSVNRTSGGVMRGVRSSDAVAVYGWDDLAMPVPFANVDIFLVSKVVNDSAPPSTENGLSLYAGTTQVLRINPSGGTILYSPTPQSFPNAPGTVTGDLLRIEYRSGQVPKTHNLTRGTVSSYTGTYTPTPMAVNGLRVDLRPPNNTPIGTTARDGFDSIKVVAQ